MRRTPLGPSIALCAFLAGGVFCAGITSASAAEIRVLSTNLFQPGLVELAAQFKQDTGNDVKIEAPRGAELTRILASDEPADIVLGAKAAVDQAVKMEGSIGHRCRSGAPASVVREEWRQLRSPAEAGHYVSLSRHSAAKAWNFSAKRWNSMAAR